ncbi:MAG: pilus assembly protein [Thalassospira sp.]|nr:pilus assembly protein [Thalassospira sp.]
MIEAGLLMPIFLFMTFAIVDYGLMMSERSAAAGNISSLTRTIQDNPQISIAELNTLIANTGFGNGNLTAAGNCLCAKSFSTQAQAQSFTADTGCSDAACTAAGRNTGIGTPRFIGVRGEVTYNFITPVHNIFTGNNAQVMRFGKVVPVGVTVCPAGQALTSAGVCAASTITCGAGQFLTASGTCSATVPDCKGVGKALQFDAAKQEWQCVSGGGAPVRHWTSEEFILTYNIGWDGLAYTTYLGVNDDQYQVCYFSKILVDGANGGYCQLFKSGTAWYIYYGKWMSGGVQCIVHCVGW